VKSNRILLIDKYKQKNDSADSIELVSAGSIEKNKGKARIRVLGTDFQVNGEKIDVALYKELLVDGRSMSKFGIQNGDIVLIDENYKKEDLSRGTDSIIVFQVQPQGQSKIEYKLRKFIDFYDFQKEKKKKKWVEANHSNLDKKKLMDKYREENTDEKKKECANNHSRLVISETRRRGDKWYQIKKSVYYSLHPENRIFGKVEYKVPRERVCVLKKV
jgi:hypothetical protein